MLESRLSLDDASRLFKVSKEDLTNALKHLDYTTSQGLKYLINYESIHPTYNSKLSMLKASFLLNRLKNILTIEDNNERNKALEKFVAQLYGPVIKITHGEYSSYTKEEKEAILKYRLKYALNSSDFLVDHCHLRKWESELEDGELKTKLNVLRNYFHDYYQADFSRKRSNY